MAQQDKTPYNDPEYNRQIVLAAFNSLDMSKVSSEEELTRQITRRATTVAKMLSENSIEMRTLNAIRIYADIIGVEFEEKSQRYLIKFCAVRNNDDRNEEQIRTPRMDTFDGRVIKPMIDKLIARVEEQKGQDRNARAVIYKYNEPAPEGAKGPNVPSHGYRNCCWLEVY